MTVATLTFRCPNCQLDFNEPFCDSCGAALMTMPAVVCAWCSRTVREGAEPVSHGICEDCKATQLSRINDRRPSLTFAGEGQGVRPGGGYR